MPDRPTGVRRRTHAVTPASRSELDAELSPYPRAYCGNPELHPAHEWEESSEGGLFSCLGVTADTAIYVTPVDLDDGVPVEDAREAPGYEGGPTAETEDVPEAARPLLEVLEEAVARPYRFTEVPAGDLRVSWSEMPDPPIRMARPVMSPPPDLAGEVARAAFVNLEGVRESLRQLRQARAELQDAIRQLVAQESVLARAVRLFDGPAPAAPAEPSEED